jgi:ESCRT-II complex subunit VPS25
MAFCCRDFTFIFIILIGLSTQVLSTGQINTIMTFYDITDPPLESLLTGIPLPLLRKAIAILGKTGRSQIIAIADGEGVRFLSRPK